MCTKESKMNYKFDGSKVYFTSDTHFYHSNIIGFCKRPFKNVEDMNETLIGNWNRVVSQDDIVFHLGDFCLGGSHEWTKILNRLNGKIYLILGNSSPDGIGPVLPHTGGRDGFMALSALPVPFRAL